VPPVITINGGNPATVSTRASCSHLLATITTPLNLTITTGDGKSHSIVIGCALAGNGTARFGDLALDVC
jgi:hypothetical protein